MGHPALKIELMRKGETFLDISRLIITCNELPALCRTLLLLEWRRPLPIELKLIVGDELDDRGVTAEEKKATEGHRIMESCPADGEEKELAITDHKQSTTTSRERRLFEPFRQLHSIRDAQIIGQLSDQYKAEIIAEISKPSPSNQDLFDHVLTAYQKAMCNLESGDFVSSILDFRHTLDELNDARYQHRWIAYNIGVMVTTGPYAGSLISEAYMVLEFAVWTNMAWACVKTDDFKTAHYWCDFVVPRIVGSEESWGNAAREGFKVGMIYYLHAQIIERCNCIACCEHAKCSYPRDAITTLKLGLQYEAGNRLLEKEFEKELEKKKLELAKKKGSEAQMM